MPRRSVFIGYRREDTADVAGRMYDALSKALGKSQVFKDVDNLRPGSDFAAHIQSVLPQCRVFLALIGPGWTDARNAAGSRRLDDPDDWVRKELEIALTTPGLEIIPVLVNGAALPKPGELPDSLRPLLRHHAAVVRRDPDFRDDVRKLLVSLNKQEGVGYRQITSWLQARRPSRRTLVTFDLIILIVASVVTLSASATETYQNSHSERSLVGDWYTVGPTCTTKFLRQRDDPLWGQSDLLIKLEAFVGRLRFEANGNISTSAGSSVGSWRIDHGDRAINYDGIDYTSVSVTGSSVVGYRMLANNSYLLSGAEYDCSMEYSSWRFAICDLNSSGGDMLRYASCLSEGAK